MARTVRRWRGTVHQLLVETANDLTSLVARSNKYKAKDVALAIFTDEQVTSIQEVIGILDDVEEDVVKR